MAYVPDELIQGAYAPSKYAPNEIQNSMFLSLKKALMRGLMFKGQTSIRYSVLPPAGAESILGGQKIIFPLINQNRSIKENARTIMAQRWS